MRFYEKPIAFIGAISIAYHEVIRGRRTGVCEECGRLNHATAGTCLCGGQVDPNDPPTETEGIDEPPSDSVEESLTYRLGILLLSWSVVAVALGLVIYGVGTGAYVPAVVGLCLAGVSW